MSTDTNKRSKLVMALGLVALLLFSANFVSYINHSFFGQTCREAHHVEAIHATPVPSSPPAVEEEDLDREIELLTLELHRLNREISTETPRRHRRSIRMRVHNAHRDRRNMGRLRSTLQENIQVELHQAVEGIGCEQEMHEVVIHGQR